jgi:glucose/arabinose dehydrogenase
LVIAQASNRLPGRGSRNGSLSIAYTVFLLLIAQSGIAAPTVQSIGRDSSQLYAQFCNGCHGEHLEGGKGPSLLHGPWRHGRDDASLLRTILHGYPKFGMPGFAAGISPAEAHALIAFIREKTTRSREPQPASSDPLPIGVQHSEVHSYRLESIAEGLDVPWSMTFLPDDRILVNERVGRLRLIEHGHLLPEPIGGVPKVIVRDEAGLMSVVADPDYAKNGWIYLSFSDPGEGETAMTKIIRGRLREGQLVDQQTIFSLPPQDYQEGYTGFGCRLVFTGGYLFFSVGERGQVGDAQKLALPNGKIHRVFPDGRIPPDNPFVGKPGAFGSIWAYGVRNPQGLAVDRRTGSLWESEHGPRGGDELNWIRRGRNYGWPVITYGMNYDGTAVSDKTETPGMEQPVMNWTPSIAASEIEFYTGDRFPHWKNDLFVGSLAQQKFLRLTIDTRHHVTHVEEVFKHLGRVRDIKTGPDGLIYVALELVGLPGRIVRLIPAD